MKELPVQPERVTPEWVSACADVIAEVAENDDESAHSFEDDVYLAIIMGVAHGACDNPQKCADAALRIHAMNFARWCA